MSTQAERFAGCVKRLTKEFRPASLPGRSASKKKYSSQEKESIAIAICTKSILWPQGRTLKRFYMEKGKPILITQKRKSGGRKTKRSKSGVPSPTRPKK
jgi:hypothetical protein